MWPRAQWVRGNPPPGGPCYALESRCHPGGTVTLHATLERAEASKRLIDFSKCGGRCRGDHRIYLLHDGTPAEEAARG
jgi:hypothetical protein